MATKQLTPVEELEKFRKETAESVILQNLKDKANKIEDKAGLESKINNILHEFNDNVMYNVIIEMTNLSDIQDRVIFPGYRKKKFIKDVHISDVKIGETLSLFEEEEDDPFYMHSDYIWKTANIVFATVNSNNDIIIYTEDCRRYRITFENNPIFNIFNEEISA